MDWINAVVKALRKVAENIQNESQHVLLLEQDYELASLYYAMSQGDEVEKMRSKKRLQEIHEELKKYRYSPR